MVTIGQKIKIFNILLFGGKRAAFAKAAGVSPGTIGALERDEERQPHRQTIIKIEAAIGRGLNDPDVEAAFCVLANDHASADAVLVALHILESNIR